MGGLTILLIFIIGLVIWLFCHEIRQQATKNTQLNQARELARIAKEQERQSKEQERFDREQERQAQELAKQEQRLDNLYFKIEKAEDEILHFSELAERLEEQRDAMQEEIETLNAEISAKESHAEICFGQSKAELLKASEKMKKRRETLQGKIIKLDNQIFTAEQRIKKANYERDAAHNQLGA